MTRKLFKNAIFIDLHCHLSAEAKYYDESILSIYNYVVGKSNNKENIGYYSIGYHPWFITSKENLFTMMEVRANNEQCLFIGESGLDKLRGPDMSVQEEFFLKHIDLSEQLQKPLIVHNVKSIDHILKLRKSSHSKMEWIIHDFNGNEQMINDCIKRGIYFSIGPTYFTKSNSKIRTSIKKIPIERIFLETDEADYSIEEIYIAVAKEYAISLKKLQKQIKINFLKILKMD